MQVACRSCGVAVKPKLKSWTFIQLPEKSSVNFTLKERGTRMRYHGMRWPISRGRFPFLCPWPSFEVASRRRRKRSNYTQGVVQRGGVKIVCRHRGSGGAVRGPEPWQGRRRIVHGASCDSAPVAAQGLPSPGLSFRFTATAITVGSLSPWPSRKGTVNRP